MPLGGHMGAMDDHVAPWLANERAMIADAASRDLPIFAICLGAQLVAAALGGEVRRSPESEIGIYEIISHGVADPVFDFGPQTIAAQWHEDIVTKLPEGAVRLASSLLCENQIYKFGSKSYAVQFHPEIDSSIIHTWEEHADNAFLESGKSSVESEVAAVESKLFEVWKPTVQRWGALIQK
jgi:GMP synthase-like glutamine amidotransferase